MSGTYPIGLYWVTQSIADFTSASESVAFAIGYFITIFFIAQYWLLLLFYHFKPKNKAIAQIVKLIKENPVHLAFLLTAVEYYINYYFPIHSGMVWGHWSQFLGLAPYIGVVGFSFISNLFSFALADCLHSRKRNTSIWIGGMVFIICNILISRSVANNQDEQNKLTTKWRLVQGNVDRYTKEKEEKAAIAGLCSTKGIVFDTYRRLTQAPVEDEKIDLIVWPETVYPTPLYSYKLMHENFPLSEFLKEIAAGLGDAHLLFGASDALDKGEWGRKENGAFNSSFLMDGNGKIKAVYHKNRPMPIGEEMPFDFLNPIMENLLERYTPINRGETTTLFELPGGIKFITVICFEAVISRLIRRHLNSTKEQPQIIVNISNDSWFSDTIQPVQNIFFTRWIALEYARPVVRVATTGISAIINPDGTYADRIEYGQEAYLDRKLVIPAVSEATFYQRFSFLGVVILYFLFVAFQFALERLAFMQIARKILPLILIVLVGCGPDPLGVKGSKNDNHVATSFLGTTSIVVGAGEVCQTVNFCRLMCDNVHRDCLMQIQEQSLPESTKSQCVTAKNKCLNMQSTEVYRILQVTPPTPEGPDTSLPRGNGPSDGPVSGS